MFIYKTQNICLIPVGCVETNTDTGLQRLGKLLSRQNVVVPDTMGGKLGFRSVVSLGERYNSLGDAYICNWKRLVRMR